MSYSSQNKKGMLLGQNNNALVWLIIVNAVFFALIGFTYLIYFFANYSQSQYEEQVVQSFALPASFSRFITQPWSLLTYMFTEMSIWGLITSLLWLWAFGYIMQDLSGNKRLIPVYLYGGLIAGIVFLLCQNLIPSYVNNGEQMLPMMGAAAPVLAIAIATTVLAPQFRLFPMLGGGIPLWVLTVVYAAINVGMASKQGGAVVIAHVFSALSGYVYMKQIKRGNDLGRWMYDLVNWIDNLFNPEKKQNSIPASQRHFYKPLKKPFEKRPNNTQQKLDEILDKINQKGYHHLSQDEKDFLAKISKEENI